MFCSYHSLFIFVSAGYVKKKPKNTSEYISMKYDELVFDGGKKQMGDFNHRIIDY